MPDHPELFYLLLPFLVAGIFLGVLWMIAQMGWKSWWRRFPAPPSPASDSSPFFHCPTLRINSQFLRYNNAVRFRFLPQGIEIRFYLRLFHPPLLIPYSCIASLEPHAFFLTPFPSLILRSDAGWIGLALHSRAQDALRQRNLLPS